MKWKEKINQKYFILAIYIIILCVIIFVLKKIADYFPEIMSWLMTKIKWLFNVLKPILYGFIFAYLLRPVMLFFEKKIKRIKFLRKTSRGISVVLTLILFVGFIIAVFSVLVFSITEQLSLANFDNIADAVNQMLKNLDEFYKAMMRRLESMDIGFDQIADYVQSATYQIVNTISRAVISMINSLLNISGYFTTAMFSIIIGIYFMIDAEKVLGFFKRVRDALFSEKVNKAITESLSDIQKVFSGYIQGQLCDVAFMMVVVSIALTITGVKFSSMIGIFTGLANLIPYLGPFVAYVLVTLVCVVNGEYQKLIISIIVILVIQAVDGNIIEPKFLARSIKIHPLLVIVFLIFGSAIGGIWGMLLAVPIGGYIKVVFMKWLEKKELKRDLS